MKSDRAGRGDMGFAGGGWPDEAESRLKKGRRPGGVYAQLRTAPAGAAPGVDRRRELW